MLATHGRPSTMITLSAPSCATTQVPTIGSNVAGGLPTRFLRQVDFDLGREERRHDEGCDESRGHQSLHACLLWTRTALAKTSAGELRVALPWLVMIGSGLVHIPVQMLKVNDTSPILRIEREPRRQLPIVVVRTMWQLSWRSPKQPRSLEVKKGDRVQL